MEKPKTYTKEEVLQAIDNACFGEIYSNKKIILKKRVVENLKLFDIMTNKMKRVKKI